MVSHWIYIKPCQGTFKRMESRLSKLQRLFCSTHNFKPMKSSLFQGWYGSHYHDHWFGLFSKYAKLFQKKFLPSRFNLQYKHNNYTQSLSLSTDCLKIWIHGFMFIFIHDHVFLYIPNRWPKTNYHEWVLCWVLLGRFPKVRNCLHS